MTRPTQRRFCVMTFGRSGSTSLLRALGRLPGVALPRGRYGSVDDELLRAPNRAAFLDYLGQGHLTRSLVADAYFADNADAPYAGFKALASQCGHAEEYAAFIARTDIRFIRLLRRDRASMLASMHVARMRGTWDRKGGPAQSYRFLEEHRTAVFQHLIRCFRGYHRIAQLVDPISLYYEDLCTPGYANPELDAFFGTPVRLPNARPPTSGQSYVENWDDFCTFVNAAWHACEERGAPTLQAPDSGARIPDTPIRGV